MKVKSESEVAQSCPTLRDPMDCSLPGSSVHGIFQARVLEWGAIALGMGKCLEERNPVNKTLTQSFLLWQKTMIPVLFIRNHELKLKRELWDLSFPIYPP